MSEQTAVREAAPQRETEARVGRVQGEVDQIKNRLFNERINKDPEAIDTDPVAKKIFSSGYFKNLEVNESVPLEGSPLLITLASGEQVEMTKLTGRDEDNLTGEYQVVEGTGDDAVRKTERIPLSREAVYQANLLAEKDAILKGFTGDEKAVVKAYFDQIDPAVIDEPDLDKISSHVEKVAQSRFIPTTADMRSFIDKSNYNTDPEVEAALFAKLEGKTLLEPSDLRDLLTVTGMTPGGLQRSQHALVQEIEALTRQKEQATSGEMKDQIQSEINTRQEALAARKELAAMLDKANVEEVMEAYVVATQAGTIDSEQAKAAIDAFRSGNIEGLLDAFPEFAIPEGATEEERLAIQEKRKELLKKVGEYGGTGALGILGIIALIIGGVAMASLKMVSMAGSGRQ